MRPDDNPSSDANPAADAAAPSIPAWTRRLLGVLERVATRSPQFFGTFRMVQARLRADPAGRVVVAVGLTNGRERLVVEVRLASECERAGTRAGGLDLTPDPSAPAAGRERKEAFTRLTALLTEYADRITADGAAM